MSKLRIITWDDDKTKEEVTRRYRNAVNHRIYNEDRWIRNERTIYSHSATMNMSYLQTSLESNFNIGLPGVDGSDADVNVAYTFKNFRFIHAQMSANPPSVVMRPTSSDQDDHRKADAADRVVRYSIRKYNMQEKVDQVTLNTLLYGTGICKTVWDSTIGEIEKFDQKTGEITLSGDMAISVPFMWNVYLDPDAKCWDEMKWVIERIYIDFEEACSRWPDKIDILKKARIEKSAMASRERASQIQNDRYNAVELLEYWETGLPTNGYLGRYCITTTDGEVLESVRPSPFRFRQAGAATKIENSDEADEVKELMIAGLPMMARLPYHCLTDIDIPNMVWGRSFVEYAAQLQELLNRLDSARMDNIQAHGVARMVIPESAEMKDDAITNSPWDVVKITGNQGPWFAQAPTLMPEMTSERNNLIAGINEVSGVNESMFGQQSREQSGASMQYASNQGNMIRRRLFNKYVLFVESLYKSILDIVRKHWTVSRTINVLGKENALEAIDLKGADIDGGYDIVGEYGVSLSLDPMTRREEIMTLQPVFEKAGVPTRTILRMLKLNELEGMYDKISLAENRQKEIFDEMIASGRLIPPEDLMDHEHMVAWALDYFMTSEFKYLDDTSKGLCKEHIRQRIQMAAQEKQGLTGGPAEVPGTQPPGPLPEGAEGPLPPVAGPTAPVTPEEAVPAPQPG